MIVERVKAGLRRATAQGKKLGRTRLAKKVEKAVLRELEKGRGSTPWPERSASGQRQFRDYEAHACG